jgi:hypothetical protein
MKTPALVSLVSLVSLAWLVPPTSAVAGGASYSKTYTCPSWVQGAPAALRRDLFAPSLESSTRGFLFDRSMRTELGLPLRSSFLLFSDAGFYVPDASASEQRDYWTFHEASPSGYLSGGELIEQPDEAGKNKYTIRCDYKQRGHGWTGQPLGNLQRDLLESREFGYGGVCQVQQSEWGTTTNTPGVFKVFCSWSVALPPK